MSRRNRDRKNIGGRNSKDEMNKTSRLAFQDGYRIVFDLMKKNLSENFEAHVVAQFAYSVVSIARKMLSQEEYRKILWYSQVQVACVVRNRFSQEEQSYAIINWMIRFVIPAWIQLLESNHYWISFSTACKIKINYARDLSFIDEIKSWADLEKAAFVLKKLFWEVDTIGNDIDSKHSQHITDFAKEFTKKSIFLENVETASCALAIWHRIRKNAKSLEMFCEVFWMIMCTIHRIWDTDAVCTYAHLPVCRNEASQMILDRSSPVVRDIYNSAIELATKLSANPEFNHASN